jgi:hypothetical protein
MSLPESATSGAAQRALSFDQPFPNFMSDRFFEAMVIEDAEEIVHRLPLVRSAFWVHIARENGLGEHQRDDRNVVIGQSIFTVKTFQKLQPVIGYPIEIDAGLGCRGNVLRGFVPRFLQTPPRGDALALR